MLGGLSCERVSEPRGMIIWLSGVLLDIYYLDYYIPTYI